MPYSLRIRLLLVGLSVSLVGLAACSDDDTGPDPTGAGAQGAGAQGAGAAGPGGNGGTGGAACQNASDCPDADPDDCMVPACDGGCGMANAPEGTACASNGGTICNADGECVACVDDTDCDATDFCDVDGDSTCVPKGALGDACTGNNQCENDICDDDVCCIVVCGLCSTCNGASPGNSCTALEPLENDGCPAMQACNGDGACAGLIDAPCTADVECISLDCDQNDTCRGAMGEACTDGPDCASGTCTNNLCE